MVSLKKLFRGLQKGVVYVAWELASHVVLLVLRHPNVAHKVHMLRKQEMSSCVAWELVSHAVLFVLRAPQRGTQGAHATKAGDVILRSVRASLPRCAYALRPPQTWQVVCHLEMQITGAK